MSKKIIISVYDDDHPFVEFKERDKLYIDELECENILNRVRDSGVNIYRELYIQGDKLSEAIDILIAAMVHCKSNQIVINVEKRNKKYAEHKKMTLSEVENELGYKIELVSEEE